MVDKTVLKIVGNGLCSACGVCVACCPKQCIHMKRKGINLEPEIDIDQCLNCGICTKICSVNQICNYNEKTPITEYLLGEYQEILCVQSQNEDILKETTSGGFVSETVKLLLDSGEYSNAFLVKDKVTDPIAYTLNITKASDVISCSRSKYLTVSHEQGASYILNNPENKVIFVGCGCAIQSLLNLMTERNLNRDNYLLIGLFCDKTMNYGVVDYFSQHSALNGRKLNDLYFRTKIASGWPGNLRLICDDGTYENLPKEERGDVKDYFMPERCLYCLDKLNRNSDISVGDNYIKKNKSIDGVNSIIIRTNKGIKIWKDVQHLFTFHVDTTEEIIDSQVLHEKINNYYYSCIKGLNHTANKKKLVEVKCTYVEHIRKIGLAESEYVFDTIHKDILRIKRRNYIISAIKKPLRKFKRILYGRRI